MYRPKDLNRDQTYFLFATTQEQLNYLHFPLGDLPKEETRNIAKKLNLEVADKPDSQDICFVPDGNYVSVIERFNELNENFKFTSGLSVTLIVSFIHKIVKLFNEYNQLIEYCNNQLITISYTLGLCVSTIIFDDYSYASKSNKFTLSDYNKIKNAHGPIPDPGPGHGPSEEASCSYIDNK